MKEMMRRLERDLEGKKLILNVGKSKILKCRKGGTKDKECAWNGKGAKV